MNLLSLIWGIATLLFAFVCLLPFLGFLNWLVIVLACIGAIIGAFSSKRSGLYLNLIALLLAMFRLFIGGGVI